MFIRSERLFLRPAWPEDSHDLLPLIADEAVVRNLSRVPWPYTAQDAESFVARPHERMLPSFLITVPGSTGARIVGVCGLSLIDGEVGLGYWIARSEWGQGYASEAARAVLSLAKALGHKRIVARHYVDNAASGRVLDKLGFSRTGRVVELFVPARGYTCPAREYEVVFDAPGECDDDTVMNRLYAA